MLFRFAALTLVFVSLCHQAKAMTCEAFLEIKDPSTFSFAESAEDLVSARRDPKISSVVKQFMEKNLLFPQMINLITFGVTAQQILNRQTQIHQVTPIELK